MRLQLLLLATSLSLATVSKAQSITFDKSNYDPGDAVVASLSPTAGKTIIGYGDDIDQSSHQPPADPQNIGLGTISAPGLYAVSFSFSDGSVEVYNFLMTRISNEYRVFHVDADPIPHYLVIINSPK